MTLEFREVRHFFRTLTVLFLVAGSVPAIPAEPPLRMFFIDVEGGQATLVISPSGEVLLIDAGWSGQDRDAKRIVETARINGVKQIDALLVTHFHRDHAGGVAKLAALIPIRRVFDHGENTEDYRGSAEILAANRNALENVRHTVVYPGDKIPLKGLDVSVIAAAGKWITSPLPGAGAPNPVCGSEKRKPDEHTENEASVGILLQFGNFRMLDLADLLWNQELDLMCPVNPIGTVDLLLVSHHGKDTSNSATLIHPLHPRAAIMNNAENKGGSPATFDVLRKSPAPPDLWQLHVAPAAGARNASEDRIANLQADCKGFGLQVTAGADGAFEVTNARNHYAKTYPQPAIKVEPSVGRVSPPR